MITLGDIECTALIFHVGSSEDPCKYVVGRDDWTMDQLWERYGHNVKKVTGVELEDAEHNFYAIYCEACFDPPVAIVRANNPTEAEEKFVDWLDWAHISDEDLKDYEDHQYSISPSGDPYDSESVKIVPLRKGPVAIEYD